MDPITTTILAAALPAATEFLKGIGGALSRRFVGLSVDDQLKLQAADVERLKALATLDTPGGTPTQWVIDMRASFRYIAAGTLVLTGAVTMGVGAYLHDMDIIVLGAQIATFPFSFIFGERMVLAFKGMPK